MASRLDAFAPEYLENMTQEEARRRLAAVIDRLVGNAVRAGSIVRTDYFAAALLDKYRDANFSLGADADIISTKYLPRRAAQAQADYDNGGAVRIFEYGASTKTTCEQLGGRS